MLLKIHTFRPDWRVLLLAFFAALTLWYTINAREKIERIVEIRLDYKGLPEGLVVTDGQLNKITLRLRGPMELLRSLANRELAYTVDLSGMTKGHNIIPLASDRMPDFRAYEVLEVNPSRLLLNVDALMEAVLPVKVQLRNSDLAPSLRLKKVEIDPREVTVRGPAKAISSLREVTVEVPGELENENRLVTSELPVLAPPNVEIYPPGVSVRRQLEVRRRKLTLQREVVLEEGADNSVVPAKVRLLVSVPHTLSRDTAYLGQFQVMASREEAAKREGKEMLPLQVLMPAGGRLLKVTPKEVEVIHE